MISAELISRLAVAANRGVSFPNDYAKLWMEKAVVAALFALTSDDVTAIAEEITKKESS